ncbi:MAG: hypothetical protein HYY06_11115 [Deltaproteobacteria bacterium]|nr:hypothetical protein [Deltaproteobacteria bacterium]
MSAGSGPKIGCELAASKLLDGEQGPEVTAHAAACAECGALARDISAFASLVERAREEVDVPVTGSRLRLVQADAIPAALPQPAASPRPGAVARRRIPGGWPTIVAIAAMLVGVVTVVALLEDEPPPAARPERVVMRESGEKATRPDRNLRDHRTAAPAAQPAPPAPAPGPTQIVRESRRPGPKDEGSLSPRRQEQAPSGTEAVQGLDGASAPDPNPEAEALAHRTLTGQLPRLRRCYERALRRDLRMRDAQAELSVDIAPDGSVQSVRTTGETQGDLRQCLEQTLRTTRFPESDGGIRLSVPLRFELVRGERMGSNVGRRTE